jgi:hypothetical protein
VDYSRRIWVQPELFFSTLLVIAVPGEAGIA